MYNRVVPTEERRRVCYRCHKPEVTCVCQRIPRVQNRTAVFILQHPRERLHPVGTARIASLGLHNVRLEVAWNAGMRDDRAPAWLPPDAALLYPSKGARDLSALAPSERPKSLVVLDGTWHTARTLYRDKTWLHAMPQYRFDPLVPSRYRIRREPAAHCVSSIEAIVAALSVLEPETNGLTSLLDAFDAMIDDQLVYVRAKTTAPRKLGNKRPLAFRRLPRALAEDFSRLVVVYGESTRSARNGPRALAQWTAIALDTEESFERLIHSPWGLPSREHLAHMQLTEKDFAGAVDTQTFRRDWLEFFHGCGERRIVAAWNQGTLDLLAATIGGAASRVALKGAYRSLFGAGSGSLDDVVTREKISTAARHFRGRAAVRMANLIAIVRRISRPGGK